MPSRSTGDSSSSMGTNGRNQASDLHTYSRLRTPSELILSSSRCSQHPPIMADPESGRRSPLPSSPLVWEHTSRITHHTTLGAFATGLSWQPLQTHALNIQASESLKPYQPFSRSIGILQCASLGHLFMAHHLQGMNTTPVHTMQMRLRTSPTPVCTQEPAPLNTNIDWTTTTTF
ncbi:hypothetical protein CC80DRAFT_554688 [Byssothecium circinans]|uniref:Uncharacterized protein n=1 Tax=Byssothecium circinans TaxID=147558 RepID=A0A6A5TEA5_9PLEO|nr:hypothetical protein CC80DRAFT_554688 [Byssothecium circinans]